jgi:hypothetical protein
MAFPRPHNYLQVIGDIQYGGILEIWTFGLRIGSHDGVLGVFTGAAPAGVLDDVKADLAKWWNAMSTLLPTTTRLRAFKLNAIGEDGKYLSKTSSLGRDWGPAGLQGSTSTAAMPPQCSVAVTLTTAASRGLAAKGRVFLPPLAASMLQPGGGIATSGAQTIQTAFATLCTDLNNWPGIDAAGDPGNVIVASQVREGAMNLVTGVSVGTVVDTQQRRRNALVEVRSTPSVVAS